MPLWGAFFQLTGLDALFFFWFFFCDSGGGRRLSYPLSWQFLLAFFLCAPGQSLSALVQFSHVHYAKIGLSSGLWLTFLLSRAKEMESSAVAAPQHVICSITWLPYQSPGTQRDLPFAPSCRLDNRGVSYRIGIHGLHQYVGTEFGAGMWLKVGPMWVEVLLVGWRKVFEYIDVFQAIFKYSYLKYNKDWFSWFFLADSLYLFLNVFSLGIFQYPRSSSILMYF